MLPIAIRTVLLLTILGWSFGTTTAFAGEAVKYGRDTGYLAKPQKGNGPFPAVIVIHEWWGLNNWTKAQVDHLGELGFIALAVDLYSGKTLKRKQKAAAKKMLRQLSLKKSLGTFYAAKRYLQNMPEASGNIGVVGWGMGGGIALEAGLRFADLKAAIIVYGSLTKDASRVADLEVPILGIFGREDNAVGQKEVAEFRKILQEKAKPHKIKIYPKVAHAFMNKSSKHSYDPTSTTLAWREIDAFLKENLR